MSNALSCRARGIIRASLCVSADHMRPLRYADGIIEDEFVSKDDDLEFSIGAQPVEDLCHGLRTGLLIHGAHTNDATTGARDIARRQRRRSGAGGLLLLLLGTGARQGTAAHS